MGWGWWYDSRKLYECIIEWMYAKEGRIIFMYYDTSAVRSEFF